MALALPVFLLACACRRNLPIPIAGIPADTSTIQKTIKQSPAPLTLVHTWATWCDPCREEFPELVRIHQAYADRGLSLILISADDPENPHAVEVFLHEQDSPVGSLIATDLNQHFIEALSPKWSGALPATFFYDSNGTLLAEWEGKRSFEQYAETIEQFLNP